MALGRDDLCDVWVPEDQVRIRTHGDAALARVQVENLGGVGAGHGHKLVFVHLTRHLERVRAE